MTKQVILIADQQNLFIEGLSRIIAEKNKECEIIRAQDVKALLLQLEHKPPSLLFLNYFFIQHHFADISPTIASAGYPEIIAVCDQWSEQAQKQAASLGVYSVVSKNCDCEKIWQTLDNITRSDSTADGRRYFSSFKDHNKMAALTAQQCKILHLLTRGLTNREIGQRIGCAETTVKSHLHLAYKVLGVKNRTQATALLTQRVSPAA